MTAISQHVVPLVSPRRRRWGRTIVLLALTLLVLIGGLVGLYAYWRHAGFQQLESAVAETDAADPGWRWEEIEESRQIIPPGQNGALQVESARKLTPKNWHNWNGAGDDQRESLQASIDALSPELQLSEQQLNELRSRLEKAGPALQEAHKLAELPQGRYTLEQRPNPMLNLLEPIYDNYLVARLLSYDALLQAQDGNVDAACRTVQAIINTGRAIGDEPNIMAQLVRIADRKVAISNLERILAQGDPDDKMLMALRALLEREEQDLPALLVACFRGDRAMYHKVFTLLETGGIAAAEIDGPPTSYLGRLDDRLWVAKAPYAHALYLRRMQQCVEISKLPFGEQHKRLRSVLNEQSHVPGEPLVHLFMAPLGPLSDAFQLNQAHLRCAIVALTVEQYRHQHGRWPDSLEALVMERMLSQVPNDPYAKAFIRYVAVPGGVVVYSVGRDGEDNGGKRDAGNVGVTKGTDVVFQLWDVAKRRQPPRALPPDRK